MPWLLREGTVLASLEVAEDRSSRRKGLLGRDGLDGALLIRPARSVHTIGMRFPIDVAHLDRDGCVLRTTTMPARRIGRPVLRACCVVEAEAGCFARWGVAEGQVLEIRTTLPDDRDPHRGRDDGRAR